MPPKTEDNLEVVPKDEPEAAENALHSSGDWDVEMKQDDGEPAEGLGSAHVKGDDDDDEGQDKDDQEQEEEELVENPSYDIVRDLERGLAGSGSFNGTFSFCRAYPDAPNPVLDLTGAGTIGLPLSSREAQVIRSFSQQAPFGKGERTVVDKTVRDTWEMDSKEVTTRNPAWTSWLDIVVRDVSTVLGVNIAASKPVCDLYKLPVRISFLPHVDTEKANGMFATIIVVLPSEFTGGAAHLSHGGLSTVYDCSPKSLSETTVMAWYTDVMHKIKPITSGHRLALAFNLIHTTTSLRPALPDQSGLVGHLRLVLRSWKQGMEVDEIPEKIIYLLNHQYSQANSSGSAMKGKDAQVVAILDNLSKQYGFHLGLASLVCHVSGVADDEGGYYGRNKWDDSEDESDYRDEDNVGMMEVEESDMHLEHLVDLNGRMLRERLDFDSEAEAIPEDLGDRIQSGNHERQEYEGYMGNGAGSLERWYRRTALVIWPDWNDLDITYGAGRFQAACKDLCATLSLVPTPKDIELTDYIIRNAHDKAHAMLIVQSVCSVACTWRDLAIWVRAVKACNAECSIATLGEENIQKAVSTFGFEDMKPIIENVLSQESKNIARLQWLHNFETWVVCQNSPQLSDTTKDWLPAQRSKVLNTLKKPHKEEYKYLLTFALRHGGISFVEESILPPIKAVSGPWFLREFADHLHTERSQFEAPEACSRVIRDLLVTATDRVDFYGPVPKPTPKPPRMQSLHRKAPTNDETSESSTHLSRAKFFIKTCLVTSNEDLLVAVIDRLTDMTGVVPEKAGLRAKDVLLPLVVVLADVKRGLPADWSIPNLGKICDTAVSLYIALIAQQPTLFIATDVTYMLQALVLTDQSHLALSDIAPKLEALPLTAQVTRDFSEALYGYRKELSPPDGSNVQGIVDRLAKKFARGISITSPTGAYNYAPPATVVTKIVDALDYCLRVHVVDAFTVIIERAVDSTMLTNFHITTNLVPLIPELHKLAKKHQQPVTSPHFALGFRRIMSAWVLNILGPKPADPSGVVAAIKQWTCSCDICARVRIFLTEQPGLRQSWPGIGAPKRKHVEGFLQRHARGAATWATIGSSPQGISVTKTDALLRPAQWRANRKTGDSMLASISGDPTELETILGTEFSTIVGMLNAGRKNRTSNTAVGGPSSSAASHHIAAGPSSTTRSDAKPPKKRVKTAYNEDDVIDLT